MTVFMSPKTNYEFSRFDTHRWWVSVAIVFLLVGNVCSLAVGNKNPLKYVVFFGPPVVAMTSKQGRKNWCRMYRELFYGSLYGFTGVASKNGDDEVCG